MILRKIARPMLASAFVASGAELLRAPRHAAATVQPMLDSGRDALPAPVADRVPQNAATAMRIAGAVQVGGGVLLATGKAPRFASAVLATTLVPVTVYDGAFWTETDPVRREARKVGLIKNVGLLGGALIASADTAGEPSLAWRTRNTVQEARVAGLVAAKEAQVAGKLGKRAAKRTARRAARHALRSGGHPVAALALPAVARVGKHAVTHLNGDSPEENLHELAERAAVVADKARGRAEVAAVKVQANAPVVAAKVRNRADEAAERIADRAPLVADRAREGTEHAKDLAISLGEKAREQAPVVADRAREGAEQAKDLAEETGRKVKTRWRERRAS
ncbi:hypothetical protein GOHSU_02_01130 [Gordonia hirsuta DSM 44140 = NBRC 16056]|uniref:DoxX family protein n=1 Tax=Gordonia hirsuta DSM 44140 = NBRC 16056 TaxID=1121927 RepID=L7L4X4_9ACTN|nr:DoxX family protein [Gordonia hirsuta]GAC55969.1 hypothetical protein GOHSU_02_01130 [Gordonia hirsuta DSM 44140 = NBRC 16056]